jgi:hypothetical protein
MSTHTESALIGRYVSVKTGYNWHDGDEYTDCLIVRKTDDGKLIARAFFEKEYIVKESDIRYFINVTETQKYFLGDEVTASVYSGYGGDLDYFCTIIGVKSFGNRIEYKLRIINSEEILTVDQNSIKSKVRKYIPTFKFGQLIGVEIHDTHPYSQPTHIKYGTITAVKPDFNNVFYTVKFDDGTVESSVSEELIRNPVTVKTAAQKEKERKEYLKAEEQRLLQQLENVRLQMRN